MLKIKSQCPLVRIFDDLLDYFKPFAFEKGLIGKLTLKEAKAIEHIERLQIPQSVIEFRSSKYFTTESQMKKYSGLLPNAKPVSDAFFKKEPVYLKSDVTTLHSKDVWKRYGRQVKEGEQSIKRVKKMGQQADLPEENVKYVELYGFWQTKKFKNELTAEGKIPVNDYGNLEVFNGPLPPGTVHVAVP